MSKYSICIIDTESNHGLKYHLTEVEKHTGWMKFSCFLKFDATTFQVAQPMIIKLQKDKKKNETNNRPNKTKKSKKPTRKS